MLQRALNHRTLQQAARRPFTQHVSALTTSTSRKMHIHPVPVRDDNYAYVIVDPSQPKKGVFVDPFDLKAVQAAASKIGVEEVVANITTHHHFDHSGGNEDFQKAYPKAKVYGGSNQIPALTNPVKEGDTFPLFDGSKIQVTTRHTPCHTQDSTAFFLEDSSQKSTQGKDYARGVFTGDTLFISGCGRFFEGTAEEMHTALNKTLASLPGDTVVFCGHEYTKANVAFSQGVLPNRPAIKSLVNFIQEKKNNGVSTGVFTIDDEKKHNVFMLVEDQEVQQAMGMQGKDPVSVMAALREAKNSGKMMSKV